MACNGNMANGMIRGRDLWPATLAMLFICLSLASPASAQTAELTILSDWSLDEVTWADRGGLPVDSEFVAPLAAHYNMSYGAILVGVNVRTGGTAYYAAVASYQDRRLSVLDSLGPFERPVRWHAGPYHAAASLPSDELVVWLAIPGEYPQRVHLDLPYSQFACLVFPPPRLLPGHARWAEWTIIIASEDVSLAEPGSGASALTVELYDGFGRFLEGLPVIDLLEPLEAVAYSDYPLGEGVLPYVLYCTAVNTASAYFDYGAGRWYEGWLAGASMYDAYPYLDVDSTPPLGLVLFHDDSDPLGNAMLQQLDISAPDEHYINTRWGVDTSLGQDFALEDCVFIRTTRSRYPLLVATDGWDIMLAYHTPPPAQATRELNFHTILLHRGERRATGGSEVASYPVLGIAGASHWSSGDPTLFWVQLGGRDHPGGQLWSLEYAPGS